MKPVSKATAQRLRYAGGYLALGLLTDASDELELIEGEDRLSNEVLILRSDLYMQAKQWDLLEAMARELTQRDPNYEKGWIDRAYALREMERVPAAKAVLLEAELIHGKNSGVLHFNLACYHCLLGELEESKTRLRRACQLDDVNARVDLTHLRPSKIDPPPRGEKRRELFGLGACTSFRWGIG